jgi:predicted ATPase
VTHTLLDRDAEFAMLAGELAAARGGAGRVVVVEGPAGIGKSSLLAAAARAAKAEGMVVLAARGGPLEQDAAWGIARRLFGPLRRDPEWSRVAVGAAALAERALDPVSAEPAHAADAMHATAHGLTWLAGNLAERAPVLLAVDDVHWADVPSLRWLAQLARDLDGLTLAVVCSVRSGEPPGDSNLLAELLAAAPGPPIRPGALGPAATEALVRERLPHAHAHFAAACHAARGGNPFLLRALLAQLIAEAERRAPRPPSG